MKLGGMLAAAAISAVTVSSAHAQEHCKALSKTVGGDGVITPVALDLESTSRLDPNQLPEKTSAVLCRREAIVPTDKDVRVLTDFHVNFAIAAGGRSLWIRDRRGRLQASVEGGELSADEAAAVDAWLKAAQPRYTQSWR